MSNIKAKYYRLVAYTKTGMQQGVRDVIAINETEVHKYAAAWIRNNDGAALIEIKEVNDYPLPESIFDIMNKNTGVARGDAPSLMPKPINTNET